MNPTLPTRDAVDPLPRVAGPHPDSILALAKPSGDLGAVNANRTHHVQEHSDYLNRIAAEGVVSHSLAETARTIWEQGVVVTDDRILVPSATAVEGGPIRYTWDHGDNHLEAEIPDSGPVEWFYQNRKTGEVWSTDVPVTASFPPSLCTRLFQVVLDS
jgi:hypothetical protein